MDGKKVLFGFIAGAALVLSALPARPAAAAAPTLGNYYLALGDSLSAGYQPDPTVSWTHGWVYQFRDMLAKKGPVELTDIAIGGECTGTFIKGGLSPLCTTKTVSSPPQLTEATAFINSHPGMVRLITVEVGGDNLYGHLTTFLKSTPAQGLALTQQLFPPLVTDWTKIFTSLRQACATCEIIAVGQYNPIPPQTTKANVAAVITTYNATLTQVAAPFHIRVANVYTPFLGHELAYTWIARGDIHANNQGYTVMAQAVAKASGLVP